jgi:hypothetical protein
MTETFPPGYVALSEWIEREANLRFSGPDIDSEQRWGTFDAACQMFAAKEAAWGVIVADDGSHKTAPQSVWLSSSAARRQILETGRAKFKFNWHETFDGRLGIWKHATLVPAAPAKQETEAEKIARQAEKQAKAGKSISDLAGSAPDLLGADCALPPAKPATKPVGDDSAAPKAKPSLPDARLREWVDTRVQSLNGKHPPSQRQLVSEARDHFRDHRVTRSQVLRLISGTPLHVLTPGKRA